jgi:hypothetical protein
MDTGKLSNPTLAGLLTPLKAIRARCLNCMGFDKTAVRECGFADCLLHALRMGRGSRTTLKPIRFYCLWCCAGQRAEVRLCPAEGCPLWQYRAGRRPKTTRLMSEIGSTAGGFVTKGGRRHISPSTRGNVRNKGTLLVSRDRACTLDKDGFPGSSFPGSCPGRDRGRNARQSTH